jgi:hypothetical protein
MANTPAVINKREDVINKIGELYPLLADADRYIADSLHKLATDRDMKIGIGNIRSNAADTRKNYDITYSAKKPRPRSIFIFKICVVKDAASPEFGIKARLHNIGKYRQAVEAYPDKIKDVIKNIKECNVCSASCRQQFTFTLDGGTYNSCPYGGEIFAGLSDGEWDVVRELVIHEYDAHATEAPGS